MPRKSKQLAKLARPVADRLIERPRLFTVLDQACHQTILWVMAPAGAGKTSLISSYLESRKLPCLWYQIDAGDADLATFFHYLSLSVQALSPRKQPLPSLTPEYLPSLQAYVRRFFRLLFERLQSSAVLVFDNFHDAPPESPLHGLLAGALNEIPPDNTVIFISRYDPPPSLARSYSNSAVIDWAELKLNAEEAGNLLCCYGHDNPDEVHSLIDAAQGWAAGLVLLARTPENAEINFPKESQQPQILYDYFMQEVFNKIPETSHDILIKTALLPSVTPATACLLTGLAQAAEIIAELHRERYFIDRHNLKNEVYVYHPLFRSFLLMECRKRYSEEEFLRLKCQAARILEESKQIETAIDFYIEAGNWGEASRAIVANASEMLTEGRHFLLKGWIDRLPPERSQQNPSLLYWLGMSRMPFSQAGSRINLEPAFILFKKQNNITGMYLALSAILVSYYYEWSDFSPVSRWLNELEELIKQHPDFSSIAIEAQVAIAMMTVLMYCPQHQLIKSLKHRVIPLIRACPTPQQKIAVASPALFHGLLAGDFYSAEKLLYELKDLLDMKRISPADAIMFKILESIYDWKQAEYSAAIVKLEQANALADKLDMHFFDSMIAMQKSLAYAGAEQLMDVARVIQEGYKALQPTRTVDMLTMKFQEIALDLKRGEANRACLDILVEFIEKTQEIATPYYEAESRLLYSQALVVFGEHETAKPEFSWLKAFAREMPSQHIEFRALVVEANSAFLTGDNEKAINSLQRALAIGSLNGYMSCHPLWQPNVLPPLFAKALELDIEASYVRHFIRARHLKAPSLDLKHWPWPVQIFTLGRFSILIDDQELSFKTKPPKKPLELLKCIIAHGNQGVSQNTLIYELWPDLDGDAGRNAFDLALHRLRKLLVSQDALEVQDGRLMINQAEVWVDAWAFDRLCTDLETEKNQDALTKNAQRLLSLYRGHFLEGDDQAWLMTCRERLNSKFTRNVGNLAQTLMSVNACEEATELYRKAIEFDPLIEEFHRGLMQSYQAQGKISEALATYRHCQDMLSIVLGIQPSQQTQSVYRSLKSS